MPTTFSDLPPDHPIFSIGPSFVFKNDPPPAEDDDDTQLGERGRVSKGSSRMRLGSEEDLERVFGSDKLLIGFPVRPPAKAEDDTAEHDEQPD